MEITMGGENQQEQMCLMIVNLLTNLIKDFQLGQIGFFLLIL